MVPPRPISHKLAAAAGHLRSRWRPLLWGLGLWVLLVALPYAWLYPGDNLARPVCVVLALLAPVALLLAGAFARTHLLLGAGLGGVAPALIACPELIGPRITGAVQGLAVAVVLMGFIASVLDAATGPAWRVHGGERLRLWRRPRRLDGALLAALGVLWLALAWGASDAGATQAARTSRVASVALLWMAVRVVPLAGRDRAAAPRRAAAWAALVLRRLPGLTLLAGALMWWRA